MSGAMSSLFGDVLVRDAATSPAEKADNEMHRYFKTVSNTLSKIEQCGLNLLNNYSRGPTAVAL